MPRRTKTQIGIDYLNDMGSADRIAAHLKALGIKGDRSGATCPVSTYLNVTGAVGKVHSTTGARVLRYSNLLSLAHGWYDLEIKTPDDTPVSQFVRLFDSGQYPDLLGAAA